MCIRDRSRKVLQYEPTTIGGVEVWKLTGKNTKGFGLTEIGDTAVGSFYKLEKLQNEETRVVE